MFVSKKPSRLPRVLDLVDCPPHGAAHYTCNYPCYYNPIYYPEYNLHIFATCGSTVDWLKTEIPCHFRTCLGRCYQLRLLEPQPLFCSVNYVPEKGFSIVLQLSSSFLFCVLPIADLESPQFSICGLMSNMFTQFHGKAQPLCSAMQYSHAEHLAQSVPHWLYYPSQVMQSRLNCISKKNLQICSNTLLSTVQKNNHVSKSSLATSIVQSYTIERQKILALIGSHSQSVLFSDFPHHQLQFGSNCLLLCVNSWVHRLMGKSGFGCVVEPPYSIAPVACPEVYSSHLPWLMLPIDQLVDRLKHLGASGLGEKIKDIPAYRAVPSQPRSLRRSANMFLDHVRRRATVLASMPLEQLCIYLLTVCPSDVNPYVDLETAYFVTQLLKYEYGCFLIDSIIAPLANINPSAKLLVLREKNKEYGRHKRRENKVASMQGQEDTRKADENNWPTTISNTLLLQCLRDYREGTMWKENPVCAVCGQYSASCINVNVDEKYVGYASDSVPTKRILLKLDSLDISVQTNSVQFYAAHAAPTEFNYGSCAIDGLMLEKLGILYLTATTAILHICNECRKSLALEKLPKFAIANKLYRGSLPESLSDLTWIEEMVCALYRNTAHITRLYGSSDTSQPTVLHGNTCAHEMNIMSTATILPRTPADVNDMLSIVFIGPAKVKDINLQQLFRVRKGKILQFLSWLKKFNHLYSEIPISESSINLYPDDGALPGIDERVIHDTLSVPEVLFDQETAGFSAHPAAVIRQTDSSESKNEVMLEHMGVSDPEFDRLPGRTFTASALRNLANNMSHHHPDIIIRRGSAAVPEYNNPKLMPGMFPTLFPLGTGGLEDPDRLTKISFQQQVQYYIQIPHKEFRYHFSFIFVAFNIIQRRQGHLHTYFTCKKSNFDKVAEKIVAIPAGTLQSLSEKIERERKLSNLTTDERDAFGLLKHVDAVSARVPGSQASKIFIRNEIRNYFGYFGLPHIFLTLNPSPAHSPIFQVMCGNKSIDLSAQFPILPGPKDRALALARDPVAAADFYEFSIQSVFRYLLGWDYHRGASTPAGGILGKLRAFYGTSEFTERGCLHGHFLIWLVGGVNPNELHKRLEGNIEYQKQFFSYFESIIHHELPPVEVEVEATYEPRTERPPLVPEIPANLPKSDDSNAIDILNEWDTVLATQIKMCGEVLQRHVCRAVCHKYGNDNRCRFLFPHEIVDASYYDPETKSVVLLCRDGNVNYFNPYILVFCRHNHDIKCILSGKGAKAAMFYLSDYITKLTLNTYQVLSLLSKVVAQLPDDMDSATASARRLLHKCLSQFSRQQQIHGQQAVRYIQGHNDGISSHRTVSMMSGLLLKHVHKIYRDIIYPSCDSVCSDGVERSTDDESDTEPIFVKIATTEDGRLSVATQIDHYWYRADALGHLNFYDFCRCVKIEKIEQSRLKNTPDTRLGVLQRHKLKAGHPLHKTHRLVEHTNEKRGDGVQELVPRVVGVSIPRTTSALWPLFALAHFKPFSPTVPLLETNGMPVESQLKNYQFSSKAEQVLVNWDAIHECEDERDAHRLQKQESITRESQVLTAVLAAELNSDNVPQIEGTRETGIPEDLKTWCALEKLQQAFWFKNLVSTCTASLSPSRTSNICTPDLDESTQSLSITVTPTLLRDWKKSTKVQESALVHKRRNALNPDSQTLSKIGNSEAVNNFNLTNVMPTLNMQAGSTSASETDAVVSCTNDDILKSVEKEFKLNAKQKQAFDIIGRHYIQRYIIHDLSEKPLRMLMTGPGGTGKTHVVKAVKKVMSFYGCDHRIRFLAPTGSAASNIDGMTIHKGLGIKISRKDGRGKGNRALGTSSEDYSVLVSVQNKSVLRDEWKNVDIVLVDEVSLASAQLLCDIDHALRFAKENSDDWFGGITVIFAGDFFQYPPVGGTPLFSPISTSTAQTENELMKRLGRLAWKSVDCVIELTEQQRMKDDPEYGDAVQRLRVRKCTFADVDLFNTRVIKSFDKEGVDMGSSENINAAAIVSTNRLREALNARKAQAMGQAKLVTCAAKDVISSSSPLTLNESEYLLKLNFGSLTTNQQVLPGFIQLYESMPVILRSRNISTELKITNGSQGFVRHFTLDKTEQGHCYCSCVIVEFPDSPIKLDGLKMGYFPIEPSKFTFAHSMNRENSTEVELLRVTRFQLPIQPGFAVTGHSAQGKTLPKVLAFLDDGGFGAYVSASQARTRYGLCIVNPVRLSDLNKPIPSDLMMEMKRLKVIDHNTQVRYGYCSGTVQKVPDPEVETNIIDASFSFHYDLDEDHQMRPKKRKRVDSEQTLGCEEVKRSCLHENSTISGSEQNQETSSKRRKLDGCVPNHIKDKTSMAGCSWSSSDWSCAYDSLFMILYSSFVHLTQDFQNEFASISEVSHKLAPRFLFLHSQISVTPAMFDQERDNLRDDLSLMRSTMFPRRGHALASVTDILEELFPPSYCDSRLAHTCSDWCLHHKLRVALPNVIYGTHEGAQDLNSYLRAWVMETYAIFSENLYPMTNHAACLPSMGRSCNVRDITGSRERQICKPYVYFEIHPDLPCVQVSKTLTIPCMKELCSYRLAGIVYHGNFHFSSRLFLPDDTVWVYDGQINGGYATLEVNLTPDYTVELATLNGKKAHVLVYAHSATLGE